MWPNRCVNIAYSTLPVFCDEQRSVDSNMMSPIQTKAGHQARARLGREAVKSAASSHSAA